MQPTGNSKTTESYNGINMTFCKINNQMITKEILQDNVCEIQAKSLHHREEPESVHPHQLI